MVSGQDNTHFPPAVPLVLGIGNHDGFSQLTGLPDVGWAVEKCFEPLVEVRLVCLERKEVVCPAEVDAAGDGFLAAHGVKADCVPLQIELPDGFLQF